MTKNNIKTFLEKKVSRRQFLFYIGLGFLSLTGISGLVKKLSSTDSKSEHPKSTQGFGSSPYGGKEQV